jgi:hypothetical protein
MNIANAKKWRRHLAGRDRWPPTSSTIQVAAAGSMLVIAGIAPFTRISRSWRAEEPLVGLLEARRGGRLHRVGLHHRDAGDRLLELVRAQRRQPLLGVEVAAVHGAPEGARDPDEQRVRQQHQRASSGSSENIAAITPA